MSRAMNAIMWHAFRAWDEIIIQYHLSLPKNYARGLNELHGPTVGTWVGSQIDSISYSAYINEGWRVARFSTLAELVRLGY